MLRPELIQAVRNDLFQVYAAGNLSQVLEMLTGASPGHWRDGRFTADSMFDRRPQAPDRRLTGRKSRHDPASMTLLVAPRKNRV